MQNTAYGTYRDGTIILDEPVQNVKREARVVVVFLDNEPVKPKLIDLFSVCGSWEDTRSAEEIIEETRNSRFFDADVQL